MTESGPAIEAGLLLKRDEFLHQAVTAKSPALVAHVAETGGSGLIRGADC